MTLDLEPIKARLATATPGRWCYMNNHGEPPAGGWNVYGPDVEVVARHATRGDATLIANAPADLAALVAEVERLRARVAELEADADNSEALDDAIWEGCFGSVPPSVVDGVMDAIHDYYEEPGRVIIRRDRYDELLRALDAIVSDNEGVPRA